MTSRNASTKSNQTGTIYGFEIEFHSVLIVIAILVIISNMLVIVLFVTKDTLRKGGKLLLFSLAISDVTTGLVTIPLNILCEVTFSIRLCMSSGILNRFLAISTVYHILAITFETYYAIIRPMEHRVKVERQKVLGIALAIWLGALIIAVAPLFWAINIITNVGTRPSKGFLDKMAIYEVFVISFGFLLPLTLMVFAHARMFTKVLNALKLIHSSQSRNACKTNKKNKYKTAILFAVILVVFTICWLFWFVAGMLKAVLRSKHSFPKWAVDCLTIIRYSTSFINPLLYTFFRPDFHTAFKASIRAPVRRRPSVSFTYLLSNSSRAKRDSQTTSTMMRELQGSRSAAEKDTKVKNALPIEQKA